MDREGNKAGGPSKGAKPYGNPKAKHVRTAKEVRVVDPCQDDEGTNPSSAPSAPEEVLTARGTAKRRKVKKKSNRRPRAQAEEPSLVNLKEPVGALEPVSGGKPTLGGANYHRWLEEQKLGALMQKLSEGTRLGYESAWRQWVAYRTLQEKAPLLEGRDREERRQDEEDLITFVVYFAQVLSRSYSTLQQKLYAIRYAHLVAGYNDPLQHRVRLWTTLAGLKKAQDGVKRKIPVTPRMLEWLMEHLAKGVALRAADAAVVGGAITTAFFFMLRASEYLANPHKAQSLKGVLRGADIAGRTGNTDVARLEEAEEIVIHLRRSKTDQYNEGCTRNHFKSGGALCPVGGLAKMQRHFPQRFGAGREVGEPLFRWADGSLVTREEIQGYLQLAALADGWEAGDVGSHSLRIGGATAMAHVVKDWNIVKRFGRWSSDIFQRYLWDAHEGMASISAGMAADKSELTKPRTLREVVRNQAAD